MMLWMALACSGGDAATDSSPTLAETGTTALADSGTTDTPPADSGTADSGTLGARPSTLTEHGVVTCADPGLRDSEGPMELRDHGQAWDDQNPNPGRPFGQGIGVAVEDFDGDGHWDIFLGQLTRPMLFLGNGGDGLTLATENLPVPAVMADLEHWYLQAVTAADLDSDGDPDLVLGSSTAGTRLWQNEAGVFTDVTDGSGLSMDLLDASALAVGDLDGDGHLDLFLGHDTIDNLPPDPGQPNGLYLNQGDGTWTDISDRLSDPVRDGYTQTGSLVDLDQDGAVDLLLGNHRPEHRGNRFLLGDGAGNLVEAPDAGLDLSLESMGTGLGDVNGDGLPDLLISSWGALALLESAGPGDWVRTEKVRELIPDRSKDQEVAWGNALADLDNDGDLDAIVGFSPSSISSDADANPQEQPDGLWLREGEVFVDAAADWGLRQKRDTRGVLVYDHNDDGWLDVLKTADNAPALLWTARCGDAGWLAVDLVQPAENPRAIGARVAIEVGGVTQTRWITAGSTGFLTSEPPRAHFGVDAADRVDRLSVTWPDGHQDVFTDVAARQRVTVTRPAP